MICCRAGTVQANLDVHLLPEEQGNIYSLGITQCKTYIDTTSPSQVTAVRLAADVALAPWRGRARRSARARP